MGYKVVIDKMQGTFLPACLDYIPPEHLCCEIEAFTEQLDLVVLGYKYAECKKTGCPPYDPRMMLNLYIYGYLNRVRSSRRLEAETKRNVEVMWLMGELRPDDKTISDFRKDNKEPIKKTFREFVRMFRDSELCMGLPELALANEG
jgi:transposase